MGNVTIQKSAFTLKIINNISGVRNYNYAPGLPAGELYIHLSLGDGDNFCNLEISFFFKCLGKNRSPPVSIYLENEIYLVRHLRF